jgi:ribosome recycling factor
MIDELLQDAREHMEKSVDATRSKFGSVRTGRATPHLLDRINVDYYGTQTPLNQLAGISVPEPHQIVIQPWDRSVLGAIERAITKSDIGLTPNVDGAVVRLNIPPLTEERRHDLVKQVHKRMEEARVEIRNLRRDAADQLKKLQKDGEVGVDEERRLMEELQRTTDRHVGEVDRVGAAKEQEVLEV